MNVLGKDSIYSGQKMNTLWAEGKYVLSKYVLKWKKRRELISEYICAAEPKDAVGKQLNLIHLFDSLD